MNEWTKNSSIQCWMFDKAD